MLITFKSAAAADVLMYKRHAKILLDLLGKSVDQGVITAEEMPGAIATLEGEITASKRPPPAQQNAQAMGSDEDDEDASAAMKVSFAARAFPLLEMMKAARDEDSFVMWGV